jgi:photosystem II stability/assembly factor-like uncharacterized protein
MKSTNGDTLPEASRIVFATKDTGWFAKSLFPAKLYKTVDGGNTWTLQKDSVNSIHQIAVASNMHVSFANVIDNQWYSFSSTDGGTSWDSAVIKNYKGNESYLLTYIDTSHLFWCGYGFPYLFSYSNKTWARQDTTIFFSVPSDVQFISDSIGWISMMSNPHGATESGSLVKTTTGGRSWFYQGDSNYPPVYFGLLKSVFFVDTNRGYAVASSPFYPISTIYSTTDGGDTWTDTSYYPASGFHDLLVLEKDKLLIPSDNGVVWVSRDGGKSLYKVETGLGVKMNQILRVGKENFAYVFGETNTLLKFDLTPLLTSVKTPESSSLFSNTLVDYCIYPNPFNNQTNFHITLSSRDELTIEILSVTGQRIKKLNIGMLEKGTYDISWDGKNERNNAVSSGVYFAVFHTNNFIGATKILLIK